MSEEMRPECAVRLDGISADLDAFACQAMERHSRDCPRCATVAAGLCETIGPCREAGSAPLPDSVRQRAKAGIERRLASEPNSL